MKLITGGSVAREQGASVRQPSRRRPKTISSSRSPRAAKRALDLTVSGAVLLLMLPVVVFVALAIVIDSRGPVFFTCERVGRGGAPFRMRKFRKMRQDASGPPLTTDDDPRFTRMGRWLTKTKLDELPQLWHVFRGDMSLVGPRPEHPSFVADYPDDYDVILSGKQGITGLSQLAFFEETRILDAEDPIGHYRDRIWPQKIGLDRLYVERATFFWDVRILFWTVAGCLLRTPVAVNRRTGELGIRRRWPTETVI
jgi:lipopolysaccharide/colanic/teichoic acid biosynthesis glycosyltransferase